MKTPDDSGSADLESADITDRKNAEEQIRSLARFPDENPNPVLRAGSDGRLLYANSASEPLLRFWETRVGQDVPAEVFRTTEKVLADAAPASIDVSCGARIYQVCFAPIAKEGYVNLYAMDVTDRKRAEKALKESEKKLKAELEAAAILQQVSTQLIHADDIQSLYDKILDAAARFLKADCASIQIYFPERGENGELRLIGHRGFNGKAAGCWEWVGLSSQSACGIALKTGQRIIVKDVQDCGMMVGSDDMKIYLQTGIRAVQTTPLISRSGKLLGMLSTHWHKAHEPTSEELRTMDVLARLAADRIDRKQAEEALKKREQRLRLAADGAELGVFEWNVKADVPIWENRRMYEIFGLSQGDPPVNRIQFTHEFVHPEDLPRFEEEIAESMRTGNVFKGAYRIRRRCDGEWRWIEYYGQFEFTPEGKTIRLVSVLEDITERKRAEEERERLLKAVEEESARLQAIMESLPVAVWVADSSGKMIMVNDVAADIYGGKAPKVDEIGAYSVYEIYCPNTRERIPVKDYPLTRALRGETVKDKVVDFYRFDGHKGTQIASSAPVLDSQGNIIGGIVVAMDITNLKRMEKKLRHLNETLEQQVAERTAIAEKRTYQLQQLALELSRAEEQERQPSMKLLIWLVMVNHQGGKKHINYSCILGNYFSDNLNSRIFLVS
jgi:PAS domain S-box-containing protein